MTSDVRLKKGYTVVIKKKKIFIWIIYIERMSLTNELFMVFYHVLLNNLFISPNFFNVIVLAA